MAHHEGLDARGVNRGAGLQHARLGCNKLGWAAISSGCRTASRSASAFERPPRKIPRGCAGVVQPGMLFPSAFGAAKCWSASKTKNGALPCQLSRIVRLLYSQWIVIPYPHAWSRQPPPVRGGRVPSEARSREARGNSSCSSGRVNGERHEPPLCSRSPAPSAGWNDLHSARSRSHQVLQPSQPDSIRVGLLRHGP
jgi:hypothetical protein